MAEPLETLKLLADATRLRIIRLLAEEELSVAELQEILDMGQSRISSHLAILRQAGVVADRRDGKRSFYRLRLPSAGDRRRMIETALSASRNDGAEADQLHLKRILERRRQQTEKYFDEVAGRLGRNYCPGRSWEAIGHLLLHLVPPIDVVDLGAGEGILSQLIARRAKHVHCVDSSPKMVEFGAKLARRNGIENLTYIEGDIEEAPLDDGSVDLALLSQALHHARSPQRALREAFRVLRPGGTVLVLDLKEHQFERARELYGDVWLGFTHVDLHQWLRETGFEDIRVDTVARETMEPHFETLLAAAYKPTAK